jgi:hypothetical protein
LNNSSPTVCQQLLHLPGFPCNARVILTYADKTFRIIPKEPIPPSISNKSSQIGLDQIEKTVAIKALLNPLLSTKPKLAI